jgi:serine/threonine-protein kinase RsbW
MAVPDRWKLASGGVGGPSDDRETHGPRPLTMDFDVPTDVGLIGGIVQLVTRQLRAFDYPADVCTLNVPVALSEALSNAMLRGNAEDPAKTVHVRVVVDPSQIVLEVTDEGGGFDLERCTKDPTTPDNVQREDGRGLFLMRRLMDRVERFGESGAGARNMVRLTLYRAVTSGTGARTSRPRRQ